MTINCLFCDRDVTNDGDFSPSSTLYTCKCCGFVNLGEKVRYDFPAHFPKKEDRIAISITLRNEWEIRKNKPYKTKLTLFDLEKIIHNFRPLNPIEKMDHTLLNFQKLSRYVGSPIPINHKFDYFLYYCVDNVVELRNWFVRGAKFSATFLFKGPRFASARPDLV